MQTLVMTYSKNLFKGESDVAFVYSDVPSWFSNKEPTTELLPPPEIEEEYARGNLSNDDYVLRYLREVLFKLNPQEIFDKYKNITLCGKAKPNNDMLDNRFVIAAWLRSYGFSVKERDAVGKK